ncbi:MAG: hypothetical protein WC254_03180 [Candidatus Woesearchaeota archaeon]|jgi:hypothetical protein
MKISPGAYVLAIETSGVLGAMERMIRQDSENHKQFCASQKRTLVQESGLEKALSDLYFLMPGHQTNERTSYVSDLLFSLGIQRDSELYTFTETIAEPTKPNKVYRTQKKYSNQLSLALQNMKYAITRYNQNIPVINEIIKKDYKRHTAIVYKCNWQYSEIRASFRRVAIDPILLSPIQYAQSEKEITSHFKPTSLQLITPIPFVIDEQVIPRMSQEYFALYNNHRPKTFMDTLHMIFGCM